MHLKKHDSNSGPSISKAALSLIPRTIHKQLGIRKCSPVEVPFPF